VYIYIKYKCYYSELAPAIKAVFEQNKENLAIEKLIQFTEQREQEIEKICQNNYQVPFIILILGIY
jgi:glutathione peroxidase-family protein